MTYNQKRHIQLLRREQDFQNQGKSFFVENQEEYFELSEYNIAMQEHIFWPDRYQVSLSMEDFLNKKIDGEELCDQVHGFRCKLISTFKKFILELTSGSQKIKVFQPDGGSKKLSRVLTGLFCTCDHFEEDYQNDEFYTSIKDKFLNFQKALNEE